MLIINHIKIKHNFKFFVNTNNVVFDSSPICKICILGNFGISTLSNTSPDYLEHKTQNRTQIC